MYRHYSRKDGRQRQELGRQVGQVDQQEHEEGLDDAHLFGEACEEGQDEGEDQANYCPPNADDEEGGWRRGGHGAKRLNPLHPLPKNTLSHQHYNTRPLVQ